MKIQKWIWSAGLLMFLVAAVVVWRWRQDAPRRACLDTAAQLQTAIQSGDTAKLLQTVALPEALLGRTEAEQSEFLRKALAEELSPEGLVLLQRKGAFGPLQEVLPAEAQDWAAKAGVRVADCVAFRLEHGGGRACRTRLGQTINSQPSTAPRILRCNNVKQLAASLSTTASAQ